jgi:exopolyphosphatase/guanosine-5'-triphosphate,3'-diphosphate pyrophosphatase
LRLSNKNRRDAIAVFDVGTNTVLYLLMARDADGELVVEDEGFAPTRLGKGLALGEPSATAVERTVRALASFVQRAERAGLSELRVVGTEVLRRGRWSDEFAEALWKRLGLRVDVLTPKEEGQLTLLAARRSLALGEGPLAVVDVGGGSAQLACEGDGGPPAVASYGVGCVLVTERFFGEARTQTAWEAARNFVRGTLVDIPAASGDVVITGGTATTTATLKLALPSYDAARVHGYVLSAATVAAVGKGVFFMPLSKRRRLIGMPAGRADVYPAGALALAEFLDKLGADSAVVSAQGVRYGVAYRYFDEENNRGVSSSP